MLNERVQKCSGKEGVLEGLLPLCQDTQKRGSFSDALDSSHQFQSAPSCPAGLERHKPSLERNREEVGGFRVQRAVKW